MQPMLVKAKEVYNHYSMSILRHYFKKRIDTAR
jgi:hypothetical protein